MPKLLGLMLAAVLSLPAADSALLNLAMPDARIVAGANLTRVRNSPFGQFLLSGTSQQQESPGFQRFIDETGFDPRRDLEEIVFASPGGRGETHKLILARGIFDPPRLISLAMSHGARVTTYNGVDIVTSQRMALAFVDNTTAVAGDIDSVQGAIDRRHGGQGLSPGLVTKIDALSAAQDAWFVSKVPVAELNVHAPQVAAGGSVLKADAMNGIEGASGGVTFGNTVNLCAEIAAHTPQDAAALADMVRLLAALAQLQQRPGTPQIAPLLKSLDVKTTGAVLTIGLAIPEELIESNLHIAQPSGR